MNNIVVSGAYPEIRQKLMEQGYNVIVTDNLVNTHPFESDHADMQCLKINDTIFVNKSSINLIKALKILNYNVTETEKSIEKKYPHNVILNSAYVGNKLYCLKNAVDNTVKMYCTENNIEIINVNQGYTKCSTAIIDDNSIITSDAGIYKTMTQNGVEGLLISQGNINLTGVDYGFIGGCSFSDNDTVYFSGDIAMHSDYKMIKNFCDKKNKNILCLSNNNLYDIGGFVVI